MIIEWLLLLYYKSALICFCGIVVAAIVDRKTMLIPPLTWILPLVVALLDIGRQGLHTLLIRVAATCAILLFFVLFRLAMKKKFGLGDIKLIAASIVSFGLGGVWFALFIASVTAIPVFLLVKPAEKKLPFAPFLALGYGATILIFTTVPACRQYLVW